MFKRKLRALNFLQPDSFDINEEGHVRNIVLWLEDQKIRHYKIDERTGLRDLESSDWDKAFAKYLSDINCPYPSDTNRAQLIDWILGYAVGLEYTDNVTELKSANAKKIAQMKDEANPKLVSDNPLDRLSFDDPEFKKGVEELAKILKIPQHPNHLITLKAVSIFVRQRLSSQSEENTESKKKKLEGTPYKLDQYVLGIETNDYVLSNAARALRLLHIQELRQIQTHINETIVTVQNLTANPRTDDSLGKVGF